MSTIRTLAPGIVTSAALAAVCWFLGTVVPIVGGAVFAILSGMIIGVFWKDKGSATAGIKFTSKKILQTAVVFAQFGLPAHPNSPSRRNLAARYRIDHHGIAAHGIHPVPRTSCAQSHRNAYRRGMVHLRRLGNCSHRSRHQSQRPRVAHAISVVFLFNVLAALIFPTLGDAIGMTNDGFGLFAGTAVNDTSSVTAAAAVWDGMHEGAHALDYATIVKLTRTLAIIPITFVLALWVASREKENRRCKRATHTKWL